MHKRVALRAQRHRLVLIESRILIELKVALADVVCPLPATVPANGNHDGSVVVVVVVVVLDL